MGNICNRRELKKTYSWNNLPDEIILEILSYLSIKDLGQCAQVSKRFQNICHTESLWWKINVCMKIVPTSFLIHILANGCQYLSLQWSLIDVSKGYPREVGNPFTRKNFQNVSTYPHIHSTCSQEVFILFSTTVH